jgi:hypothetical protein
MRVCVVMVGGEGGHSNFFSMRRSGGSARSVLCNMSILLMAPAQCPRRPSWQQRRRRAELDRPSPGQLWPPCDSKDNVCACVHVCV